MPDENTTFKVCVNEFVFSIGRPIAEATDIIKIAPGEFNLIKDHRSINARVLEADASGKKLKIEVDGESFDVEIKDTLDQVLEKMGFGAVTGKRVKEIRAPMPGLVLQIIVTEGQQIREGERILILEAMKMENSITSQAGAVIKKINVQKGQAVEKGQVLIELE